MHIKKVLSSRIFWGHQVLRTKATVSTAIILLWQTLYTDSSCLPPHVTFDLHSSNGTKTREKERKRNVYVFSAEPAAWQTTSSDCLWLVYLDVWVVLHHVSCRDRRGVYDSVFNGSVFNGSVLMSLSLHTTVICLPAVELSHLHGPPAFFFTSSLLHSRHV